MGLRSFLALFTFVSLFGAIACSKSAQKIQPDTRGKRGETCLARNDCDTGLACINGICSKNEFDISVAPKQCDRVECSSDEECCGDRATMAPAKCKDRDKICDPENANIPGCIQTTCVSDDTCNGGTCRPGICSGSGQTGVDSCTMASDCPKDTCVIPSGLTTGTCKLSNVTCTVNTDCFYFSSPASCSQRTCDCVNPEYDPTKPICTDKACENICLLRCSDDSRCVEDTSCKTDTDCLKVGLQICDGGRCVQCTVNDDCDVDQDETCEKGLCHKPCKQDEECGLFEACNKKSGDCEYVGCKSDRECILAASGNSVDPGTPGPSTAPISGSDDPRLFKCLPSESDPKVSSCKIPCENDGSCGQFQACDNGYCKFIGCETDEECRAYLHIANQMTSDTKPYIASAVCREAPTAKSTK